MIPPFLFYLADYGEEMMKHIDIVVPCYNEEEVLPLFMAEAERVLGTVEGYIFRYIFVDDGSRDGTLKVLRTMAEHSDRVKYLSFSRNFGKEAALYAGLSHSTGDYVVVMDADLQHPPALIPQMIAVLEDGHDCCAAKREHRRGDGFLRSAFSRIFFRLSNKMTHTDLPYGAVDYRMMCRDMVDAVLAVKEEQRFSKGLFSWVGFDTRWIPYEDVDRPAGRTKWNFKGLVKYAFTGILSFSTAPLEWISVSGFFISFFAFVYCIWTVIKTLVLGIDVPGYATLLCVLLLIGGIIELSVGIIGLYLSRVYAEVKRRPMYIVKLTNLKKSQKAHTNDESENTI